MAGQGILRRDALRMLAIAAVAGSFPGFERWVFGRDSAPPAGKARYAPRFFTKREFALAETLVELIIPADETPGAREAGVAEFIDFMVSEDPALQIPFREGMKWLDSHSRRLHRKSFLELSPGLQQGLLEPLAYRDRHRPGEEKGRAFFTLLRGQTVMGYYTSRIGLEALGYPGLQQAYASCPECPHTADPEHRHLPAAAGRA